MANGPFVEDVILNQTEHPDAPDSIKVRNTVLIDSRIKNCIMALNTAIDTVGLPTVEEMLTTISNTEGSVNTLNFTKADANHTHTHAGLIQNQDFRHVPEGGVNGDVLVFDAAEPTMSKWSTVPAAPAASRAFTYLIGTPPTITASVWCFYDIIAAGAPVSIILPNTVVSGDLIRFRITGLSLTVIATFVRNGLNIEGIADDGIVSKNGNITIEYVGIVEGRDLGWVLYSGLLV